jgi:hypothetical protein
MLGETEGFVTGVACCSCGPRCVAGWGSVCREGDDGAIAEAGALAE